MEYKAVFGIDCGVSPGFGVKYPDYERKTEKVSAGNAFDAIIEAAKKAIHFSRDYLSNPDNDLTTVTLLGLYDSNNNPLNVRETLKEAGYNFIQRFDWSDEGKLVTKCSMLEHLMILALEKKERK